MALKTHSVGGPPAVAPTCCLSWTHLVLSIGNAFVGVLLNKLFVKYGDYLLSALHGSLVKFRVMKAGSWLLKHIQ